jgi:hypothetical protein
MGDAEMDYADLEVRILKKDANGYPTSNGLSGNTSRPGRT